MEESQVHIPDGWKVTSFGDKELFRIIGSGIKHFSGEKEYYATSSIDGNKVLFAEQLITFKNRPSRANMQPIESSVWFAKMKNTFKILKAQKKEIEEVILSTGFSGIESEKVDCDFLMQILSSSEFNSQKNLLAEGSTQEAVNNTKIKEIKFLLPEAKQEQTQIASILSKVDDAIAQTEQLIAKYTRIKTGLMQDLLTKGIDEHGNIRSEQTHEFKDSPLGRIPKEWEVVDITKYTKNYDNAVKPGPFGSSVKKEFYTELGYKIYGQEQVIANDPFIGDYFIDEKRYKSLFGFRVASGDVLLSCVGTIGSVLIIPNDFEEGIINPRLIKFSLDAKKTNIYFFAEYLKHSSINSQLINLATGGTMPVLNKKIVLSLTFIYPPIEEQNRINEKWQILSNHIKNEEQKLSKLQSLKTGLMQDLLSGKVRVNHLIKEMASV